MTSCEFVNMPLSGFFFLCLCITCLDSPAAPLPPIPGTGCQTLIVIGLNHHFFYYSSTRSALALLLSLAISAFVSLCISTEGRLAHHVKKISIIPMRRFCPPSNLMTFVCSIRGEEEKNCRKQTITSVLVLQDMAASTDWYSQGSGTKSL